MKEKSLFRDEKGFFYAVIYRDYAQHLFVKYS